LSDFEVIGSVDEICSFPHARLGIVCQTTLPPQLADELIGCIRQCNPAAEIVVCDTICEPTRRRQQALESLLAQVQAIVVIGGKNSNNTLQLVAYCRRKRLPVLHVNSAAELDFTRLAQFDVVGLTAGTSTLDETMAEVYETLVNFTPLTKVD
jgi:4-hydroxy-3-methylbut-2-enyl diphosphate reductase